MTTLPALTVSELNGYVKKLFDGDVTFANVMISGEISNFSPHYRTGQLYFSLKDAEASVRAVMFAREAQKLRFKPENGMKVIAAGRVTVYERDGVYQLYVRELIPEGVGALAVAFEQLKARLAAQGLFDASHKKTLPSFPLHIGVVTSPGGAALQDILQILDRRFPLCRVTVAGASVQGVNAPRELIAALNALQTTDAQLIILARGGGSAEDLWCFNDERLARAIYACRIPLISAVGHETDFTIADLVSDLRAPTPSAAAELAVPDVDDLRYRVAELRQRLNAAAENQIALRRARLRHLLAGRDSSNENAVFSNAREQLLLLIARLNDATWRTIRENSAAFSFTKKRLALAVGNRLASEKLKHEKRISHLRALDPMRILSRGYAVVQKNGAVIDSIKALSAGERITLRFFDGSAIAQVVGPVPDDSKKGASDDGS